MPSREAAGHLLILLEPVSTAMTVKQCTGVLPNMLWFTDM